MNHLYLFGILSLKVYFLFKAPYDQIYCEREK